MSLQVRMEWRTISMLCERSGGQVKNLWEIACKRWSNTQELNLNSQRGQLCLAGQDLEGHVPAEPELERRG